MYSMLKEKMSSQGFEEARKTVKKMPREIIH